MAFRKSIIHLPWTERIVQTKKMPGVIFVGVCLLVALAVSLTKVYLDSRPLSELAKNLEISRDERAAEGDFLRQQIRSLASRIPQGKRPEFFEISKVEGPVQDLSDLASGLVALSKSMLLKSHGKIVLPAEGAIFKDVIVLDKPITITGGPLYLSTDATFEIINNGKLVFNNIQIFVVGEGSSATKNSILMRGGSLEILHSKVEFRVTRLASRVTPRVLSDSAVVKTTKFSNSEYNFINIAGDNLSTVKMVDNKFLSKYPYSTRLILQSGTDSSVSATISDNFLKGLHGAIFINSGYNLTITRNEFMFTSYGSIFVAGHNINIEDNRLIYSGMGIVGDSITIAGGEKISILGNMIFGGTCYGISVFTDYAKDIVISRNHISSGITQGVALTGYTDKAVIENVVISDNIFANNAGFGASLQTGTNIQLKRNIFHNNSSNFDANIYVEPGVDVTISDNTLSVPVDPKWATSIDWYRSNVLPLANREQLLGRFKTTSP